MDPLVGAVVAAGAAWLSILAAVRLPGAWLPVERLRAVGGASLGLLGLVLLGVPIPAYVPIAVLAAGMALAALVPRPRRPTAGAPDA